MWRTGRIGVVGVGLALVGALTGAPRSEAGPSVPTDSSWLMDVSVDSSSDAWAVGFHDSAVVTTSIAHWDGHAWATVESPDPGAQENMLYGVEALSATDVWAVGRYGDDYSKASTLVEHWDGTRWSVVPSPNSAGQGSQDALFTISAVSPDDIWAAGYAGNGPTSQLIEHWNGQKWRIVSAADGGDTFAGMKAIATDDVWAVGDGNLEHWDGSSWKVAGGQPGELADVSGTSPSDLWAVGNIGSRLTLTEHWDGSSWTVVPSPNGAGNRNALNAVCAISPSDAWAVGHKELHGHDSPLLMHWDGVQWLKTRPPGGPATGDTLYGIDASSSHDVWAVGTGPGFSGPPAIEHWDGAHWHRFSL
jgi:hypothetical protein